MENLTPNQLYILTWALSALTAVGALMGGNKPIGTRVILHSVIVYGGLGSSFGMVVGLKYLGGKESPWIVVALGQMVALREIKMSDITKIMRRILGMKDDDHTPK